ncbi:MAG: DUF1449 domain-containing protein [Geitlerinemataceae cyanobacterium]
MVFNAAHWPYWVFLGAGLLLFAVSISTGGEDALEGEPEMGLLSALLFGWLGIGRVPFLLLVATDLSLWGVLGWAANVALGVPDSPLAVPVFVGSGIAAVLLGGAIARPLGQIFFAPFSEDARSERLVGCLGTVSSAKLPRLASGKVGQIDVVDPAKNLVTVNAAIPNDAQVIPQRGDRAIVIEQNGDRFVAIADGSIDRDRWLGTLQE